MAQIQRARLLTAAVAVVDEFGCGEASVARITGRAGVSRRTFYELFENRDDCLLAVLRRAVDQAEGRVAAVSADGAAVSADGGPRQWRERVRLGLWAILGCLDEDPTLARVCIVQFQHVGGVVQEARMGILEQLAAIVDEARVTGAQTSAQSELTAQGLVGGIVAILHDRLSELPDQPLGSLLGELMAMLVLPYLGPAASRRERQRLLPAAAHLGTTSKLTAVSSETETVGDTAGEAPPMRLTYRTVKVLEGLAGRAGASNREVADHAGVNDQGQISKLLGRLDRLGLVVNDQAGASTRGEPNRWSLTQRGTQLVAAIGSYQASSTQRQTPVPQGKRRTHH